MGLKMSEMRRKKCPLCDAVGKDLKEVDDREKPIYQIGNYNTMYSKKTICKKCGCEF